MDMLHEIPFQTHGDVNLNSLDRQRICGANDSTSSIRIADGKTLSRRRTSTQQGPDPTRTQHFENPNPRNSRYAKRSFIKIVDPFQEPIACGQSEIVSTGIDWLNVSCALLSHVVPRLAQVHKTRCQSSCLLSGFRLPFKINESPFIF